MTPTAFRALDPTTTDRAAHRPHTDRDTPTGETHPAPPTAGTAGTPVPEPDELGELGRLLDEPAAYLAHTHAVDYLTARHRPAQLREGQDR